MKKLLPLLFFKLRLVLIAAFSRFIILPIIRALFRRMARQAEAMAPSRPQAAHAPNQPPREPQVIDGEWRRISNDHRQNW